jgi:hypothetical protein
VLREQETFFYRLENNQELKSIRWKIEKRFGPKEENNDKIQGEEWIK